MSTLRPECIIIELYRIPVIKIRRAAANAAGKIGKPTNQNLRGGATRKRRTSDAKIFSGSIGINRRQALVVVYRFMVSTQPNRVHEARREDMRLLQGRELSRRQGGELNVVQSVRRCVRSPVKHVSTEQAVVI